ncbi:hypothetical protein [Ferrovibrio sp.]|uniref:hypothetical protein n=1 Tax=Ferrovibrio sp. TaxID=1917215 RepID=UPI00311D5496
MTDIQLTNPEPRLSDDEWKERFIKHMLAKVPPADEVEARTAPDYARQAADAYLPNRDEYDSPEEAADTDISYWEE